MDIIQNRAGNRPWSCYASYMSSLARRADLAFILPARFRVWSPGTFKILIELANLVGFEGDGGCDAVQNCYPDAMM